MAGRILICSGGVLASWAIVQAKFNPLHLVWDLDNTLLLSLTPIEKGVAATASLPPSRYFDQIDDDFPYQGSAPNTRTTFRPGAKMALQFMGLFATQHVFTAAQASYTDNIMRRLDPQSGIFTTVTHRDLVPHHDHDRKAKKGKDLSVMLAEKHLPRRAILFDDRLSNFTPQPANGVHVRSYDDVTSRDWEMARLCLIATLALLAPDVRPVLKLFRSQKHTEAFFKEDS
mmetsp:Transcript_40289/g.95673  ORF Transcript_40289/g.95673 Transcript_40289/m.95673 type:complete len:229 (+) Transcript_40289:93-779(+)